METPATRPSIDQALEFRDYSPEHLSALKKPLNALSTEQAVTLIGQIYREIENVEDYLLRLRWCLGFVLAHTERPFGSAGPIIEEIIHELWDQYQIRAYRTLLYECERLYHAFAGDFPSFLQWLAEQKAILGRPVRWADIRRLCLGGRNNPDVIGREAADEQDYRDAEQGIEAIERIMERARKENEEARCWSQIIRLCDRASLSHASRRTASHASGGFRGRSSGGSDGGGI